MPQGIPAVTVIATKMASGTVQWVLQNANGGVRYAFVQPSADVTSVNTNVNGGSTGATRTFVYAQDANNGDYPTEYVGS